MNDLFEGFIAGTCIVLPLELKPMNLYRIEPDDDDTHTYVLADSLQQAVYKYSNHVASQINTAHKDEAGFVPITPEEIECDEVVFMSGGDYLVL